MDAASAVVETGGPCRLEARVAGEGKEVWLRALGLGADGSFRIVALNEGT